MKPKFQLHQIYDWCRNNNIIRLWLQSFDCSFFSFKTCIKYSGNAKFPLSKNCLRFFFIASTPFAKAQISGEIRVGQNQKAPYQTLVSAISVIQKEGINGPLCFVLEDTLYETEPLHISDIPGSDQNSIIEIKPVQGVKSTIKLVGTGTLFTISTSGKIIIDGRNFASDTTQNLVLQATNSICGISQATDLASKQMNLTVRNCIFNSNTYSKGGAFNYSDIRYSNDQPTFQDSIYFIENRITGFQFGLTIEAQTFHCERNIISNCYKAIYFSANDNLYSGNVKLINNTLIGNIYGIYCESIIDHFLIKNNKIIGNNNSLIGMDLMSFSKLEIINNVISGDFVYGIHLQTNNVTTQGHISILYNTISVNSNKNSSLHSYSNSNSCLIFDNGGVEMLLTNNILESDHKDFSLNYPFYLLYDFRIANSWDPSPFVEYGNCFFHKQDADYWGLCSKNAFKTYTNWIDVNNPKSIDKANSFVSSTDLHLTAPNHQGIPIPEITTDIEGNPRDPLHPDAGAYEFKATTTTPSITQDGQCQLSAINFSFKDLPAGTWTVNWNFGDGQTGTGTQIQHIFGANGSYVVTATIAGTQNYVLTKTIEIQNQPTKPSIIINNGK